MVIGLADFINTNTKNSQTKHYPWLWYLRRNLIITSSKKLKKKTTNSTKPLCFGRACLYHFQVWTMNKSRYKYYNNNNRITIRDSGNVQSHDQEVKLTGTNNTNSGAHTITRDKIIIPFHNNDVATIKSKRMDGWMDVTALTFCYFCSVWVCLSFWIFFLAIFLEIHLAWSAQKWCKKKGRLLVMMDVGLALKQ